ncbi:F-box protein SKIP23-like [Dioscorea cayenensis subsp. rotundata]|uniref:F-box protein SKIP23-like n=1 Tax=Dioscorea cayennensis subsp. rotundata TaxID=55577 RepID=A0AB40CXE2_DIOCR|nr:F-box protein SKIP23-like [Dioscorea cayenensis subsp. rotundata]
MAKLPLDDHLHLTSVCRHYHLITKSLNLSSPAPSSPWLILPGRSSTTLKFLPQTKTTPYEAIIPSPFIRRRLFIGSSNGWLVTVSCNPFLDLHLLNPLTGTQHSLPPIHTLPFITSYPNKTNSSVKYQINNQNICDYNSFMNYFFTKAVISTKDFTVVLAHRYHNRSTLCYTRPNLSKWISFVIPYNHMYRAIDVIHDNGLFYALTDRGDIIICGPSSITRVLSLQEPLGMMGPSTHFIVRSLDGDLLMVGRLRQLSDKVDIHLHDFRTCDFEVFRIENENNDQMYWKQVDDLGEQSLFLGDNESMVFSALKYPELQRNCIYFTEGRKFMNQRSASCKQPEQCDMGVYNLSDRSIKKLLYPSTLTWPPPIWFTPHIEGSH